MRESKYRVVQDENGKWIVTVNGRKHLGPFDTREEADREADEEYAAVYCQDE